MTDTESKVQEVMRLAISYARSHAKAMAAQDIEPFTLNAHSALKDAAALESAVRALAAPQEQPLGAPTSGPGHPLGRDAAIRLWHGDTETHGRVSAFEWFAAGILAAERAHGIGPLPAPPASES